MSLELSVVFKVVRHNGTILIPAIRINQKLSEWYAIPAGFQQYHRQPFIIEAVEKMIARKAKAAAFLYVHLTGESLAWYYDIKNAEFMINKIRLEPETPNSTYTTDQDPKKFLDAFEKRHEDLPLLKKAELLVSLMPEPEQNQFKRLIIKGYKDLTVQFINHYGKIYAEKAKALFTATAATSSFGEFASQLVNFYEQQTTIKFESYFHELCWIRFTDQQKAFLEEYPPENGAQFIENAKRFDLYTALEKEAEEEVQKEAMRCDQMNSNRFNMFEMSAIDHITETLPGEMLDDEDHDDLQSNASITTSNTDAKVEEEEEPANGDQPTGGQLATEPQGKQLATEPQCKQLATDAQPDQTDQQSASSSASAVLTSAAGPTVTTQILSQLQPIRRDLLTSSPTKILSSTGTAATNVSVFTRNICFSRQTVTTSPLGNIQLPLLVHGETLAKKKHPFTQENQNQMLSQLQNVLAIESSAKSPPPNKTSPPVAGRTRNRHTADPEDQLKAEAAYLKAKQEANKRAKAALASRSLQLKRPATAGNTASKSSTEDRNEKKTRNE